MKSPIKFLKRKGTSLESRDPGEADYISGTKSMPHSKPKGGMDASYDDHGSGIGATRKYNSDEDHIQKGKTGSLAH